MRFFPSPIIFRVFDACHCFHLLWCSNISACGLPTLHGCMTLFLYLDMVVNTWSKMKCALHLRNASSTLVNDMEVCLALYFVIYCSYLGEIAIFSGLLLASTGLQYSTERLLGYTQQDVFVWSIWSVLTVSSERELFFFPAFFRRAWLFWRSIKRAWIFLFPGFFRRAWISFLIHISLSTLSDIWIPVLSIIKGAQVESKQHDFLHDMFWF